jgi:hypothetical protein
MFGFSAKAESTALAGAGGHSNRENYEVTCGGVARRFAEVLCFVADYWGSRQRVVWNCVQGEGKADGGNGK